MTVDEAPARASADPVAKAIGEATHHLGFHLGRIEDRLQVISDRLGELVDAIEDKHK